MYLPVVADVVFSILNEVVMRRIEVPRPEIYNLNGNLASTSCFLFLRFPLLLFCFFFCLPWKGQDEIKVTFIDHVGKTWQFPNLEFIWCCHVACSDVVICPGRTEA